MPLILETWFAQERMGLSAPVPWGLAVAQAGPLPQEEAAPRRGSCRPEAAGGAGERAWSPHLASLSPPSLFPTPHRLFT